MKKNLLLLTIVLSVTTCFSQTDHWTQKATFPGRVRAGAYGFAVGNKGYIGGGYNNDTVLNDFWEYDPSIDTWTQRADPPFKLLYPCQNGFTIGDHGYYLTDSNQLWQYVQLTDSWIRKADMPGTTNFSRGHFVIGSKVYFGPGYIPPFDTSFYCYDTVINTWTRLANPPFQMMEYIGFSVNNKGYFTGMYTSGGAVPTVLEYDPLSNSWTQKANFPGVSRVDAASFTIGSINYFGTGDNLMHGFYTDWWQYNVYTDSWTEKAAIPCNYGKDENTTFAIGAKGYICFGNDIYNNGEVWEYTPDSIITGATSFCFGVSTDSLIDATPGGIWSSSDVSIATIDSNSGIVTGVSLGVVTITYTIGSSFATFADTVKWCEGGVSLSGSKGDRIMIYPNPATTLLTLSAPDRIKSVIIKNVLGQTVYSDQNKSRQVQIDVADLPKGIYIVNVNGTEVRKFVKE